MTTPLNSNLSSVKELIERAESAMRRWQRDRGQDGSTAEFSGAVTELVEALKQIEIQRRVSHLLGECTAKERDSLMARVAELEARPCAHMIVIDTCKTCGQYVGPQP